MVLIRSVLLPVLYFLSVGISAQAMNQGSVGFLKGDKFVASSISGTVSVQCTGGNTVSYSCYDTNLDPVGYDYFQGPVANADEVTLSSLRPDGSRRDRTMGYDGATGRSEEVFNLWISTLFQRPLLQVGVNKIDYTLLKNAQAVQKGNFNVTVTRGVPRSCPLTHYTSTDANDCTSQYSVCQRYFEQYNYCRVARPNFL